MGGHTRATQRQDLTNCIIPHFSNYPLLSQKAADYILFTRVVKLLNNKMHLPLPSGLRARGTEEGLLQIINLRASINLGLSTLPFGRCLPVLSCGPAVAPLLK
jgi:hypothetical protein